ncbi:MAG: Holliday junction resolvase RuvX [Oscillospiraceae bacterium]|nr:Holliday junction resolvase RuvX [Oscillospiraceae bacterium]
MIIFGVDFGDTRTGWAVCDRSEMLASPVSVLTEKNFLHCAEKTAEAAKNARAELIVVGHPVNMDGSRGPRAQKCADFAEILREKSGIPVVLWDERCTTVSAHQILNVTNTRGKKRKSVVDAVAAVLILESYLAYRKAVPQTES